MEPLPSGCVTACFVMFCVMGHEFHSNLMQVEIIDFFNWPPDMFLFASLAAFFS